MASSSINQPPPSLKPVSHYLKVAIEHDNRDPVIAYWARFAAVQKSLTIDKSSPEAKRFVIGLLDWLEQRKKELSGNESVTIEAAGEAHIENYALKLFNWADQSDRAAVFNKNVVKAFYTAGILFDILESLRPPLSDEFTTARKYSKWRAAYIHNCLKNGETPVPGSGSNEDDEEEGGGEEEEGSTQNQHYNYEGFGGGSSNDQHYGFVNPSGGRKDSNEDNFTGGAGGFGGYGSSSSSSVPGSSQFGAGPSSSYVQPVVVPPPPEQQQQQPAVVPQPSQYGIGGGGGQAAPSLSVEQIARAQKYCKWAGSALNFDDVGSAVENLEKALHLLKTGQELG